MNSPKERLPESEAPRLEGLRYSFVWEDHELLEEALGIGPEDDVLSVTSGGQNVLNLALLGPRSVTAVDLNPAQSMLLELQIAALSHLSHPEFARFIGATDGDDRERLYDRVKPALRGPVLDYWDARPDDIEAGLLRIGRLDRYIRQFQSEHVHALHTRQTVDALFRQPSLQAQREFFHQKFAVPELHDRFVTYFGRESMQTHGRDPRQFAHVENLDVGEQFWQRFTRACTELPASTNFYLRLFLTGSFGSFDTGPPFLQPRRYERLREMARRIRMVTGELGEVVAADANGAFSKANLSDIFEYLSAEATEALLRRLGERMRKAGRIAWWSLLVPRPLPDSLSGKLRSRSEEAERAFHHDRAWFYRSFHIGEVF